MYLLEKWPNGKILNVHTMSGEESGRLTSLCLARYCRSLVVEGRQASINTARVLI